MRVSFQLTWGGLSTFTNSEESRGRTDHTLTFPALHLVMMDSRFMSSFSSAVSVISLFMPEHEGPEDGMTRILQGGTHGKEEGEWMKQPSWLISMQLWG